MNTLRQGFLKLFSVDASAVMAGVFLWSTVNALALLMPGESFDMAVAYSIIRQLPFGPHFWGAVMLVDAIAVGLSIFCPAWRGVVALLSGSLWLLYGLLMSSSVLVSGFVSPGGIFSVIVGLRCWMTSAMWQGR